jgi:hypothetical protein
LKWAVDPVADVVTTAGDLLYATAADTVTRLGIGTAGQILRVNSGATAPEWAAAAGGGKVLQVVSAAKTDTSSIASGTFADISGLSVSITPSSTNSKILIHWSVSLGAVGNATGAYVRMMRDSTAIGIGDTASNRPRVTGAFYPGDVSAPNNMGTIAGNFLDSPSTTSATTYKMQFANAGNATTVYVNRTDGDRDTTGYDQRAISTITVMEIGA